MISPYVGVTGFMSANEVNEVLKAVPEGTQRKLMVGVLASSKTIRDIPNKWPNRYPRAEDIAGIFPNHPAALNLIHFNTKEPDRLLNEMLEVTELAGKNFHGFQLNIRWPWPRSHLLLEYKQKYPDKVIVLQAGESVLKYCEHDPYSLWALATDYDEGCCDYILIDPSGDVGKPFDPQEALEFLECLNFIDDPGAHLYQPDLALKGLLFGIAGGLSPETLDLIEPIAKAYSNTCIDAEGRLRDENDHLIVDRARQYVSNAYALFARYEK